MSGTTRVRIYGVDSSGRRPRVEIDFVLAGRFLNNILSDLFKHACMLRDVIQGDVAYFLSTDHCRNYLIKQSKNTYY